MDPEFDVNRYFRNRREITEYNNLVKHKVLANAFYCNLSNFSDFSCVRIFQDFKLQFLSQIHDHVYPNLVRVFYTNMEYPTDVPGAFRTRINTNTFLVSPISLNRLLRTIRPNSIQVGTPRDFKANSTIPEAQVMEFVLRDAIVPHSSPVVHVLKKANLSLDMQVLAELVQCILLPRRGHMDTLTLLDVWVMGCLGLGIPIDIGYLICRYMHTARTHPQQSLPYGSLITFLLGRLQVDINDDEPSISFTPRQRISLSTFYSRHWEKKDGIWRIKPKGKASEASSSKRSRGGSDDESDEDLPAGPSEPTLSADERHNLLMARLDSLSTGLTELTTGLTELTTEFRTYRTENNQRLTSIERKINSLTGDAEGDY